MPYIDTRPSKAEIFEYWKDRIVELGIFIDWGEPSCWACGFHYDSKYDVKSKSSDINKILRAWNKIPLQRCHIIPRSLGGNDTPENIFLMCRECHDLSPNTPFPEIFYEWARSQSWHIRDAAKLQDALRSFSIENIESTMEIIKSESFNEWVRDKIGIHRPQSNYASRINRITPSTLVGLAKYYTQANIHQGDT